MAPVIDPPWRFDPLKNPIAVGWGSRVRMIALKFYVSRSATGLPALPLSEMEFTDQVLNLVDAAAVTITDQDGNIELEKVATYLRNIEGSSEARGWVFFHIKNIKPEIPTGHNVLFRIVTPPAGSAGEVQPGGTLYHVWYNFGDPFPGADPFYLEANISWDSVWFTLAEATARAALLSGGLSYHVETQTVDDSIISVNLQIDLDVWTYPERVDFPLDASNNELFDPSIGYSSHSAVRIFGTALAPKPSYTINYSVHPSTLIITATGTP